MALTYADLPITQNELYVFRSQAMRAANRAVAANDAAQKLYLGQLWSAMPFVNNNLVSWEHELVHGTDIDSHRPVGHTRVLWRAHVATRYNDTAREEFNIILTTLKNYVA